MFELLIVLIGAAVLIGLPIMFVATYVRALGVRSLRQRLERLELAVAELQAGARPAERLAAPPAPAVAPQLQAPPRPEPVVPPAAIAEPVVIAAEVAEPLSEASVWERVIGGQALGWLAVVVLLFATGFFLRYAFENNWIGPQGRVALGVLGGMALAVAGRKYDRRGWRVFSQMLTAGGIVLLYLSTYAAFGFYHLISQREAGFVLALLMVESALLALRYEAPAIAVMAVIGGLLTPILMHSDRDQYAALFLYLIALDAGVVWLLLRRSWFVIGLTALAGTHLLFWIWYAENYHPEKLRWALGFLTVVYVLFLTHTLAVWRAGRRSSIEDLIRMPLNAALGFGAAYVLLKPDYEPWLGTLAVGTAAVYALAARWLLAYRLHDGPAQFMSLAISAAFVALAIPIEADARWVALGWAAEAGVLWWFGVRTRTASLRAMAAAMALLSMTRTFAIDVPWALDHAALPVFNRHAAPSLAAVACIAGALAASRRWLARLAKEEVVLAMIAAIGCVLMVWFLVSADVDRYFRELEMTRRGERDWARLGQTWLSVWWAVYATAVLVGGFSARQAWLRWTALGLYAITVGKVFLVDMAELDELYRIAAFFVLAMVLGAAAWAYQRFQPYRSPTESA